jgi:glucose-6-phosphate isomerase
MLKLMEPFQIALDMQTGILQPPGQIVRRHLSDMRRMYADLEAVSRILTEEGDRLIYEVYSVDLPEEEGQVSCCTTIIYPGSVGEEFHMTKGHFHEKRARAEVYLGLAGQGYLVLQANEGTVREVPMQAGRIAYVPPLWAHRTVNTGDKPFIFFAAWPGDAGHDYGTIEQRGFAKLLVKRDGQPAFIDNSRYDKTQQTPRTSWTDPRPMAWR